MGEGELCRDAAVVECVHKGPSSVLSVYVRCLTTTSSCSLRGSKDFSDLHGYLHSCAQMYTPIHNLIIFAGWDMHCCGQQHHRYSFFLMVATFGLACLADEHLQCWYSKLEYAASIKYTHKVKSFLSKIL